jgi:hypothetical protein
MWYKQEMSDPAMWVASNRKGVITLPDLGCAYSPRPEVPVVGLLALFWYTLVSILQYLTSSSICIYCAVAFNVRTPMLLKRRLAWW